MVGIAPAKARPITPVGILAARLAALCDRSDVSAEIAAEVRSLWRLAADLDPYVSDCTTAESPALAALARRTAAENWGDRFGSGVTVNPLEQDVDAIYNRPCRPRYDVGW
ncbi:MAG: hypothetical protein AAFX40_06555, partial [Cyanobacteria bacterium J06639_1]